jgi:hypothetical protein
MSILSGDDYNGRKIQNKKKIGKRIRKKLGVTLLIHLLPFHLDRHHRLPYVVGFHSILLRLGNLPIIIAVLVDCS